MKSVILDKLKHNRKDFDCGNDTLNNYLRLIANQQSLKDNSRTYVIEHDNKREQILGFYTLTMISINLTHFPLNIQKKHKYNNSVALLARLAVDKKYVDKGIGSWLLVDALKKLLNASDTIGFPLVVVDAKDGVSDFYIQFGFKPFTDTPNKLFISIADIRESFKLR